MPMSADLLGADFLLSMVAATLCPIPATNSHHRLKLSTSPSRR